MRTVLRIGVLCLSLGIIGGLVGYAQIAARRERVASPAPVLPDAAAAVAPTPKKPSIYHLRGPATKSDPHLAKMLAEEELQKGAVLGILAEDSDAGAP